MKIILLGAGLVLLGTISENTIIQLGKLLVMVGICQTIAGLIHVPQLPWRRLIRWGLRGAGGCLAMIAGGALFNNWLPFLAIPLVVYFDAIRSPSPIPSPSADVKQKKSTTAEKPLNQSTNTQKKTVDDAY